MPDKSYYRDSVCGVELASIPIYKRGQGPVAQGGETSFPIVRSRSVVLALDEAVALKRRAAIAPDLLHTGTQCQSCRSDRHASSSRCSRRSPRPMDRPLLEQPSFTPVLDCIAECGAVVLVQRALWGERSEDVRLAARLLAARVPFEILCGTWPEVFMAQAQAELQGFRPQPPSRRSRRSRRGIGQRGGRR